MSKKYSHYGFGNYRSTNVYAVINLCYIAREKLIVNTGQLLDPANHVFNLEGI